MVRNKGFLDRYGALYDKKAIEGRPSVAEEIDCGNVESVKAWLDRYAADGAYYTFRAEKMVFCWMQAMYTIRHHAGFQSLQGYVGERRYFAVICNWVDVLAKQCYASSYLLADEPEAKTRMMEFYIANEMPALKRWYYDTFLTASFSLFAKDLAALAETQEARELCLEFEACAKKRVQDLRKRLSYAETEADATLRPYQNEAIQRIVNEWKAVSGVMLQMPTGTGKTRLFVSLINTLVESAERFERPNLHFLIVTHREELVEQISGTLTTHYNLAHGILQGTNTRDLNAEIIVASIQSLSVELQKRAGEMRLAAPDYIIIDEAHHAQADSYQMLWEHYPKAYKLGVTATPYRLKKRCSFKPLFQTIVLSQSIAQFIEQGYLADYWFYTVSSELVALQKVNRLTKFNAAGDYQAKDLQAIYANSEEIEQLYRCYDEYARERRGIIYAVNRLHAEMIATCFAGHGVEAVSIDSKTTAKRRKELIAWFRAGRIKVLVNVELFGEGFDCPDIEFAMLARPTRSLAVYLQQVGRALRPVPNGQPVVILDCVGLFNRFGLPERERNWTAHFNGWKNGQENYNRPLGQSGWNGEDMMEVSPERTVASTR